MAVTARWVAGERYDVAMGNHTYITDQPSADGGQDEGPSPAALVLGALAGCAAHSAGAYLEQKGLPREGLAVAVEAARADKPRRYGSFVLKVTLPSGTEPKVAKIIERAVRTCTVYGTLSHEAQMSVEVEIPGS